MLFSQNIFYSLSQFVYIMYRNRTEYEVLHSCKKTSTTSNRTVTNRMEFVCGNDNFFLFYGFLVPFYFL